MIQLYAVYEELRSNPGGTDLKMVSTPMLRVVADQLALRFTKRGRDVRVCAVPSTYWQMRGYI